MRTDARHEYFGSMRTQIDHRPHYFQSKSSHARTLVSRFRDGGRLGVSGTPSCSNALRFVSRLALA